MAKDEGIHESTTETGDGYNYIGQYPKTSIVFAVDASGSTTPETYASYIEGLQAAIVDEQGFIMKEIDAGRPVVVSVIDYGYNEEPHADVRVKPYELHTPEDVQEFLGMLEGMSMQEREQGTTLTSEGLKLAADIQDGLLRDYGVGMENFNRQVVFATDGFGSARFAETYDDKLEATKRIDPDGEIEAHKVQDILGYYGKYEIGISAIIKPDQDANEHYDRKNGDDPLAPEDHSSAHTGEYFKDVIGADTIIAQQENESFTGAAVRFFREIADGFPNPSHEPHTSIPVLAPDP